MDTAGGWKGTKKIASEDDGTAKDDKAAKPEKPDKEHKANRVLIVTAKKNDPVSFNQQVDTKDVEDLVITFRYRTKDYAGRGLELRGIRPDRGSTLTNYKLVADGAWHEITWKFGQLRGNKKIDFQFALLQGDGSVEFDDVSAVAK